MSSCTKSSTVSHPIHQNTSSESGMYHSHGATDTRFVSQVDVQIAAEISLATRCCVSSWVSQKLGVGIFPEHARVQIVLFDGSHGLTRNAFSAGGCELLMRSSSEATATANNVSITGRRELA